MSTEFQFTVPNQPGAFSKIVKALGEANINIEGCAGLTCNNQGHITLVTNNPKQAATALNNVSVPFKEHEVVCTHLPNKPGTLAQFCEQLSNAGISITSFYITIDGHQVFNTTNNAKTSEIASKLGWLSEFAGKRG